MRRAGYFLLAGLGLMSLGIGLSVVTTQIASAQTTVPPGCRSKALPVNAKIGVILGFGGSTRMGATFKNLGPAPVTISYLGTTGGTAMTLSSGREETMVFASASNIVAGTTATQGATLLICHPF